MDQLIVAPYDSTWQLMFRTQARAIRAALGSTAIRIDHIGSTAVLGLSAKPIIELP